MEALQRLREALDLVEAARQDPISIHYSRVEDAVQVLLHADDLLHLVDERAIAVDLVAKPSAIHTQIKVREGVIVWLAVVPTPPTHETPLELLRGALS